MAKAVRYRLWVRTVGLAAAHNLQVATGPAPKDGGDLVRTYGPAGNDYELAGWYDDGTEYAEPRRPDLQDMQYEGTALTPAGVAAALAYLGERGAVLEMRLAPAKELDRLGRGAARVWDKYLERHYRGDLTDEQDEAVMAGARAALDAWLDKQTLPPGVTRQDVVDALEYHSESMGS